MDTLKTPLPHAAPWPAISWHLLWQRLLAALASAARTDEDRFLGRAVDLADLERRQRQLERCGLTPPAFPPT